MKIFPSYASEQSELAKEIALALRAEHHAVLFNRSSLAPGKAYDAKIRKAIKEEQGARHRHLGELENHVAAMARSGRRSFDQFLAQRAQPPMDEAPRGPSRDALRVRELGCGPCQVKDISGVCKVVRFRPAEELTPQTIAAICEQVRVRVLRWFARRGPIERDHVREVFAWQTSGFSLDAMVRIADRDRAGLEWLLHCCACPPCALERLDLVDAQRVIYRLPKPQRNDTTTLSLMLLDVIDHLAALIWPRHRYRYRYPRYAGTELAAEPRPEPMAATGQAATQL
jgi:hypothetical protein